MRRRRHFRPTRGQWCRWFGDGHRLRNGRRGRHGGRGYHRDRRCVGRLGWHDRRLLLEAGVTVTTPDLAKFRAAVAPANAELRKVVGDADWNQWQGFVEEGRKRSKK